MKERYEMISITLFVLAVCMLIGAIFIYSQKEDSAYSDTLHQINKVNAEVNSLKTLVNSNIESVGKLNVKLESVLSLTKDLNIDCDNLDNSLGELKSQCIKLREEQFTLREKLSAKKSVIQLPQGFTVELINKNNDKGKGVKALIKK